MIKVFVIMQLIVMIFPCSVKSVDEIPKSLKLKNDSAKKIDKSFQTFLSHSHSSILIVL